MKSSVSISDPKGPFHLLQLIDCSNSTAINAELKSLISVDHFWQEFLRVFREKRGRNPVDSEYIAGLNVWHKTAIARLQHGTATGLMTHHLIRHGLPEALTIIDCGTGDGALVLQFLRALNIQRRTHVKVFLVDQSKACLNSSKKSLHKHFPHIAVSSIKSRIENVSVNSLVSPSRYSLAIFSSVLHELPRALRRSLITRWCRHTDAICISEIEGNHDKTPRGTTAYAHSVWSFYRRAFDEVMSRRGLATSEKLLCVRSIIMPEVIRIVCNGGERTIDRHFRLGDVRADLRMVSKAMESKSAVSPTGLKAFSILFSGQRKHNS